jgi:hypothetical protein
MELTWKKVMMPLPQDNVNNSDKSVGKRGKGIAAGEQHGTQEAQT